MGTAARTMQCIDCSYLLDEGGSVCPECGRPFAADDHESFRRVLTAPKRLCTTRNVAEAYALQAALEADGVHATVEGMAQGIIESEGGAIWVNAQDVDRAHAVVSQISAGSEADAGPWTCAGCGEEVDAGFDVCWNCQSERPGGA